MLRKKILVPLPNKVYKGGICSYWSAIFGSCQKIANIDFNIVKVGNTGKNLFGPPMDQWKFYQSCTNNTDLVVLNPSILSKAFFREALFARQLIGKDIPFISFFHGWDLAFEKKVDKYFINFFLCTFGKSEKIITLSPEARKKVLNWGYRGEVVVETTIVDSGLVGDYTFEERYHQLVTDKTIRILFLARMEKEKGIFELIDVFNELQMKIPNMELVLAGNGNAYYEVQAYVKEMKNIKMLGHIEGKEKAKVFKESDIYCLPSYSEGLPVSVLEAMAFGLPVLTTSVGGLRYFFKEGKMGYTSIPQDRETLLNALRVLLLEQDKMLEIAKFNFNYAQEYLMSDKVAKRVFRHLSESMKVPQEA